MTIWKFLPIRPAEFGGSFNDNSQPRGESPTLICSKSKGITDDNLWARFQKKGQDYINFKSKKGDK